jgi:hypothetical protein
MAAEFQVRAFGRNITTRMKTDLSSTNNGGLGPLAHVKQKTTSKLPSEARRRELRPRAQRLREACCRTQRSIRSRSFGARLRLARLKENRLTYPGARR